MLGAEALDLAPTRGRYTQRFKRGVFSPKNIDQSSSSS